MEQGQTSNYQGPFMYEMSERMTEALSHLRVPPGATSSARRRREEATTSLRGRKVSRTYHPDTIDEEQARIIEIKEGSEVADVDISLERQGRPMSRGRVVDKETGKPVPRVYISCSSNLRRTV